ncbi:putative G-type lectin S-receptor-like serine/threonine-protein kinase At1g61610 isoform X2 [Miscanthus floridulus]
MALSNGVGQVASIAQLAGVDAYGLISMTVEAAQTVKRNRETCQLLARRTKMIGDLLQQLQSTQLMQHTETRIPVEQLEETLRHMYLLITSCREGSYLHSCFMGGRQADQLREVQNEITFYLQLFPLVSFVDTTRTWERILNRDRPLCTEETEGGIHTVRSQYDSSLTTKDLKAFIFEDSGSHPVLKSRGQQNLGHGMNMGDVANTICDREEELLHFSFSQILVATDNLSERNLVGIGGFGHVYKGKLLNGLDIAVKRRNKSSTQGPEQFRTEIEGIPNLQHKNIIALLGCCVEGGETILVYEYMPNKSLASVIADETKRELLNWSKRFQIIEAIADGLAYLHGNSQMGIVHRDNHLDNILLDQEMNAKISDFGLSMKLAPNAIEEVAVCGT